MRNARRLLAILLVMASVAGCAGATRADRLVYGDVTVDGDVLPEREEPDDPAVGMIAPTLSGDDFDGQRVEMIPGDGESLVVFVAHWCSECRRQVTDLGSWLERSPEGADIPTLVVVTGTRRGADGYPPAAWFEETGAEVAVLVDDEEGTAAAAFGTEGLPFSVMLDGNGRVVERAEGLLGEDRLAEMAATAGS